MSFIPRSRIKIGSLTRCPVSLVLKKNVIKSKMELEPKTELPRQLSSVLTASTCGLLNVEIFEKS